MSRRIVIVFSILVPLSALLGASCTGARVPGVVTASPAERQTLSATLQQEQALPAESNPPGDIPDNQAFVTYRSPSGGFDVDSPEGWSRSSAGLTVVFADKYDGEQVTVAKALVAPAPDRNAPAVRVIGKSGRAVRIESVRRVQLPSGSAILVDFSSNSDPNSVTGKRVRLENNSYVLFRSGRVATLTLWAPRGADNVDQWRHIARSFRWR